MFPYLCISDINITPQKTQFKDCRTSNQDSTRATTTIYHTKKCEQQNDNSVLATLDWAYIDIIIGGLFQFPPVVLCMDHPPLPWLLKPALLLNPAFGIIIIWGCWFCCLGCCVLCCICIIDPVTCWRGCPYGCCITEY